MTTLYIGPRTAFQVRPARARALLSGDLETLKGFAVKIMGAPRGQRSVSKWKTKVAHLIQATFSIFDFATFFHVKATYSTNLGND